MMDARRVLVVAPHPDDEVIGCGGTLALCADLGAEVHVLVVFDGAAGDPDGKFDERSYVAQRQAESRSAGQQLGVEHYTFWNLPEGHLATQEELLHGSRRLALFLSDYQPDLVLAPWWGDDHLDHQSVAQALSLLVDQGNSPWDLWGYGVWSPVVAEHLVDISGVWDSKLKAVKSFRTQLAYDDLVHRVHSLAGSSDSGCYEGFLRWRQAA